MIKYLIEKIKALRKIIVSGSIDNNIKCAWCNNPIEVTQEITTNMLDEQFHNKCWIDFQCD